jgi:hypothetical protein
LVTLSIGRVEEEALKDGKLVRNKLLESAAVLRGKLLELNRSSEWRLGGIVAIDTDVNLISSWEEIGRVVDVVSAVTIGAGLDLGNLHLGGKVSLDLVVEASAKIALFIFDGYLGTLATSEARVRDLNNGVVGVKATGSDLDVERSINDLLAINGRGESVVTSLANTGVLSGVGTISVVADDDGDLFSSSIIDELGLDIRATLSELVVKVIASLDLELVV